MVALDFTWYNDMTYTVFMVNFGINKGSYNTLEEAIAHARALGFECAIVSNDPIVAPVSVKPY